MNAALVIPDPLRLPDIQIPVIGTAWALGVFFLIHVLFGSFTMGTLVLAPTYELLGRRDPRLLRLARVLGDINVKIFSLGATLAGIAVILLAAFYPTDFATLGQIFFLPLLGAFAIWFPAIGALWWWSHGWEGLRARAPRAHIALGYTAAALDHVFLFLIVGVDSFLLTPTGRSGRAAFFNSTFAQELGHRFIGNVSWSSLLVAGVAAIIAGVSSSAEKRAMAAWTARLSLAVGFLLLIPQAILGFLFAEGIKAGSPDAFAAIFSGAAAWLWLVQVGLLSSLLLGVNAYLSITRTGGVGMIATLLVLILAIAVDTPNGVYPADLFWLRYPLLACELVITALHWILSHPIREQERALGTWPSRMALTGTAVAALALMVLMGVIRTSARGDYAIFGQLTQNDARHLYDPASGHYP
jgi:hypothetical protein